MSVVARFEVVPTGELSMSDAIARAVAALDDFDVSYEVTATDTVVEAADASEVFAAVAAAHRAVRDDRVITSLEVDDQPGRAQRREDRVAAVERELGRPARREKPATAGGRTGGERLQQHGGSTAQLGDSRTEQSQMGQPSMGQSRTGPPQTEQSSTKQSRYYRSEGPTPR